jgi:hydroxymethylglutaryl-CoA lyase
MRDTAEVLEALELPAHTALLAIVANERGAETACSFENVKYVGYPFSISETFQLRNTHATIAESLERTHYIQNLCVKTNKEMVLYLSMGFGNPYGDPWNVEIVQQWVDTLFPLGIHLFSLSDTIGCSTPENISYLYQHLIPAYPQVVFGAHLHTHPDTWEEKVHAAWESGCRRFDGAMLGFGGCPMAKDQLTGNMATENLLNFFNARQVETGVDPDAFKVARQLAATIFR